MSASLVTGGAGFIGSHLVKALLERGERVRVFDNFSTGCEENLADAAAQVQIFPGDLRSPDDVDRAVRGVETVFHLAAFVSVPQSLQEPQVCYDVNVQGTINLLEAARRAGVRRVVLASSAAVYGESQDLPLREETQLSPLSPYAASKEVNEIYAGLYTRAFGLPVVALRFFNVYGPRQSPDSHYAAAIPIFLRRLLDGHTPMVFGDGLQRRDFIYASDVAEALFLASTATDAPGQVFNICTGQEVSLLELLDTINKLVPGAPDPEFGPPRPGDIYRSVGSPDRAARVLNFRPSVSLVDGLAQTADWMRHQIFVR